MRVDIFIRQLLPLIIVLHGTVVLGGSLFPQESPTREVKSLDGIWNFRLSPQDPEYGIKNSWFKTDLKKTGPVIPMPVPSSYNDITQDLDIRDHVGTVWYDRRFSMPFLWNQNYDKRIWLRFGSVHYAAQVWINGHSVMSHEIGHLPFEAEVTQYMNLEENLITVACDNTLKNNTVPQGQVVEVEIDNGTKLRQTYTFDFFNYAGIHRSVYIYTTSKLFIDDIDVQTDIQGNSGIIAYKISYGGSSGDDEVYCVVYFLDKDGIEVGGSNKLQDIIVIPNANLWWPYLMNSEPGYLYTMEVIIFINGSNFDVYNQKVGIRTVSWSNTTLMINNKPVYLRGFGKHEDADIRGRGLDLALVTKDYNLIKWVGANTYRTSHYPYAEEMYDFADEQGIMIINECPSVDTDLFSDSLLSKHMDSLTQLIKRDKNHPSVIMWSIANEPRTQWDASDEYFGKIVQHVKSLDTSRPITLSFTRSVDEDKAGKHLDILSFNRYYGWYNNTGRLDMITGRVVAEAKAWRDKYNKPVIMSEYGADSVTGYHMHPQFVWSEEFQIQLMSKHFEAFDQLRKEGFFIGEFIWNFADFNTDQTIIRVGGNKKGIFTRERQPKSSAYHLRARYHLLGKLLDGATPPDDLLPYILPNETAYKTEL